MRSTATTSEFRSVPNLSVAGANQAAATRVTVIHNGRVVGSGRDATLGWLRIEGGRIAAIGEGPAPMDGQTIDAGGRLLFPGFIDLHVHGGIGCGVMDGRPDSLRMVARELARHGVTSFLPTTWTASHEVTLAALRTIARCVGRQPGGATILGAHLEGPYLNAAKCGAQQLHHIRAANEEETNALLNLKIIRLVALAPEIAGNRRFLDECVRRGVAVSAAHTEATFEQIQEAVGLGLRQVTHMFNAMSPLHHREPGVVGAALYLPEILCELIADNVHVHPGAMALLHRVKGREGIILISDAVEAAGLPDGEHVVDGRDVVVKAGAVRLPDGTLAGSTLTLDRALRNLAAATGERIENLWQTTSANAARAIGIDDRKGRLNPGMDADVVVLDPDGSVWMTIVEGSVIYSRK